MHLIDCSDVFRTAGRLHRVGNLLACRLRTALGNLCLVEKGAGEWVLAEVSGLDSDSACLFPYDRCGQLRIGALVVDRGEPLRVPAGTGLLGRIIDALGRPLDGRGPVRRCTRATLNLNAPDPLTRPPITVPFVTGIRAIDGLITIGRGQRVGLFSGSGVGKSTLLGEIARHAGSDLNVIALVGERGREIRPFLENCLGEAGLQKSIVVVATAESPPLMRVRAGQVAVALADHFRAQGAHVLLLLDSLTRLAMAQRQLGLSLGEPPSSRGYTPSVFELMASLLEQVGTSASGSITCITTVLVDGDDLDEPVSDAARSLLDGHVILDRRLADKSHYPAIDILRSVSRLFLEVTTKEHQQAAAKIREIVALYRDLEDLIRIGAYAKGADARADRAIELMPLVGRFLRQPLAQPSKLAETVAAMQRIAAGWGAAH